MRSISITAALAATIAVGCSADSPIGPKRAHLQIGTEVMLAKDVHMVPFVAEVKSIAADASSVECPPGSFASKFSDTGHATHLGTFTGEHWVCSRFIPPGPPFTFETVRREAVMVAANGDQLWLRLNPVLGGRVVFTPGPEGATVKSMMALELSEGRGGSLAPQA